MVREAMRRKTGYWGKASKLLVSQNQNDIEAIATFLEQVEQIKKQEEEAMQASQQIRVTLTSVES